MVLGWLPADDLAHHHCRCLASGLASMISPGEKVPEVLDGLLNWFVTARSAQMLSSCLPMRNQSDNR